MAKDNKSGGFFSAFRKTRPSVNETVSSPSPSPASTSAQRPNVSADVRQSSASAAPSPAAVPLKSVSASAAQPESAIDTVEAFKVLCQAVTDMTASHLKVAEMTMNMIASSLNKISEGVQPKK
ncbi:MAG: hypothetical protein WCI64_05255 [Chlorobium sp.]